MTNERRQGGERLLVVVSHVSRVTVVGELRVQVIEGLVQGSVMSGIIYERRRSTVVGRAPTCWTAI